MLPTSTVTVMGRSLQNKGQNEVVDRLVATHIEAVRHGTLATITSQTSRWGVLQNREGYTAALQAQSPNREKRAC